MLTNWFADPEDRNPSFLRLTRNILISTTLASLILLTLVSGVITPEIQNNSLAVIIAILILLQAISLFLNHQGRPGMAKFLVPIAMLISTTYAAIINNGMHDINMLIFPAIIIVSALLIKNRFVFLIVPLVLLCVGFINYADMAGITHSEMAKQTTLTTGLIALVLIALISALLQLLITRLNESTRDARKNESAQVEANKELLMLKESLEYRISERTRELEATTKISERRATNFEAAAQLASTVANVREISQLLPTVAKVISEKFAYYHVAIFLNDNEHEYAILVAANSETGRQQLMQGYKLKINQTGLVPTAAKTGVLRISKGSDQELGVSEFSETKSELALPMKVGNTILGVIDIHSKIADAFDETAIGILTILADQIAFAIQNARIYNETQATLAESQMLYGNVIQQSWKTNTRADTHLGYRYTGTTPTILEKPLTSFEAVNALESGQIVSSGSANKTNENIIAVPLKLRGEVVGVINIKMPTDAEFGNDETDIVRTTADRVALALENSTLLEESQRRASREQTISQISAKIGAGTEIDTILKTAVRELGAQIGGAQITVEIGSDNE